MLIRASSIYTNITQGYSTQGLVAPTDKKLLDAVNAKPASNKLTEEQQSEVRALKNRDQEVRSHELAHLSAAGGIALSGANYSYTTGPDGVRYATGGDVSIDISAVAGDPQATLQKAETIRRAALAPANPSSQDQSVAAMASQMANKARMDLMRLQQETNTRGSKLDIRA